MKCSWFRWWWKYINLDTGKNNNKTNRQLGVSWSSWTFQLNVSCCWKIVTKVKLEINNSIMIKLLIYKQKPIGRWKQQLKESLKSSIISYHENIGTITENYIKYIDDYLFINCVIVCVCLFICITCYLH